ncbi:MAG: helix-turn-helix transcriptional regulator [Candidatus Moranbacteria bacterium]|nr:helix-turn-helix transcriptional regulator [Candidatus Moranbacteria bacterium]
MKNTKTVKRKKVKKDKDIENFLKVVADGNRMKIISVLGRETLSVTQIHKKLKIPQNLTSHHISRLKKIDILKEKKEGTFRFYSVNMTKIREFVRLLKNKFGI